MSSAFTFILLPYTRSFELPALSSAEHPFLQLFSISLPPGPLSPPFVPRCICCLSILHSTPTPFPLPPRRWWPYTDRITDSCCQSLSRRTDGSSSSSRRSGDGNPPHTHTSTPPLSKNKKKQKTEAGGEQNLAGHLCCWIPSFGAFMNIIRNLNSHPVFGLCGRAAEISKTGM